MAEKRSVERFDLNLKAFVSASEDEAKSKPVIMQTKNVSMSGAYLLTETPLSIGTKVKLELVLSMDEFKKLGDKALIKASGEVLRTEIEGMAICFDKNTRIVPFSEKKMNNW